MNITEAEEHIYHKVKLEYLKQTAKEHWDDRYGDEEPVPSEQDFNIMADIFQNNHISDVPDNIQWKNIIQEYHTSLVESSKKDITIPWSQIEKTIRTEMRNIDHLQPERKMYCKTCETQFSVYSDETVICPHCNDLAQNLIPLDVENETTLEIRKNHYKQELRIITTLLNNIKNNIKPESEE